MNDAEQADLQGGETEQDEKGRNGTGLDGTFNLPACALGVCWSHGGGCKVHTGGNSAVEQRTVKCASAYAVILWSGVQISPPGCFCAHFFFCSARGAELWWFWGVQTDEALRSHDSSVHSTRVVFIPSKDKIRVRVPMDAVGLGDCCTW